MTVMMETCLIVALSFAVFSAVATVGASLALGIGFERLRAGYEVIRKQTGFFSDQIYTLDKRVESLENDNPHTPEQDAPGRRAGRSDDRPSYLSVDSQNLSAASSQHILLEGGIRPEGMRFH